MPLMAPLAAPSPGVGGRDPEQLAHDAPRILAGFLVSYEGNETGNFWPLYQGPNFVGRKDAAEGLMVEIDHPTTSSRHANLIASARPGRIKLEDLGSTNGTFVDDEKVATGVKHELRDGQRIRFGGFPAVLKLI